MVRRPESARADASLVECLSAGDREGVRRALAAGADPNTRSTHDPRRPTLLMMFAESVGADTAERIRWLVKVGADLDARDAEGESALFYAQRSARADLVATLLALGANPNLKNRGGLSVLVSSLRALAEPEPISMLAPEHHRAIVALIRRYGSDESGLLDLALEAAARAGDEVEVARLLAAGANASFCPDISVLAIAAEAGDLAIARVLVEAGADLDLALYGPTPLDLAAQGGHLEVVRLLVEAGAASVEGFPVALARAHGRREVVAFLEASEGWAPASRFTPETELLFRAVRGGRLEDVDRVLTQDPDLDAEEGGRTALELAFELRTSDAIRLRLIAAGADVARVKNQIVWAARVAPAELLSLFTSAGADVDLPSRAGRPLQLAARRGDVACVAVLLGAGADVDAEGPAGNALADALACGHTAVAEVLLSAGASAEAAARFQPVLALAASSGRRTLVETLLDRGLPIEPRGSVASPAAPSAVLAGLLSELHAPAGAPPSALLAAERLVSSTPLIVAAEAGHAEVVRVLLERGADARAVDGAGQSALDRARLQGHAEVEALLLRAASLRHEPASEARSVAERHEVGSAGFTPAGHPQVGEARSVAERHEVGSAGFTPAGHPQVGEARSVAERHEVGSAGFTPAGHPQVGEARSVAERHEVGSAGFTPAGHPQVGEARSVAERHEVGSAGFTPAGHPPVLSYTLEVVRSRLGARMRDRRVLAAIARLEATAGSRSRPLEVLGGHELHVRTARRLDVSVLQTNLLEAGCFVFAAATRGPARAPDRLVVFPTKDKLEAVAAMGTPEAHPTWAVERVLEHLLELDRRHPFRLTEIRADLLAGEFLGPVADPRGVAERLAELCPNVLDEGPRPFEGLAERLQRDARFLLAWD